MNTDMLYDRKLEQLKNGVIVPFKIRNMVECINMMAVCCVEESRDRKCTELYYEWVRYTKTLIEGYNLIADKPVEFIKQNMLLNNPSCCINSEIFTYKIEHMEVQRNETA